MDWTIIASLIVREGLPLAEKIFEKWSSGEPPKKEDFDDLRKAASQSAQDRMKEQLVKLGIPLDDQRAIDLLNLSK